MPIGPTTPIASILIAYDPETKWPTAIYVTSDEDDPQEETIGWNGPGSLDSNSNLLVNLTTQWENVGWFTDRNGGIVLPEIDNVIHGDGTKYLDSDLPNGWWHPFSASFKAPSISDTQEGVSNITGQLSEVTLWIEVAAGVTPADPDVSWRFDDGWRNADNDGTPVWGNWRTSRTAADSAGSGNTFWTARRQFSRTVNDDDEWEYSQSSAWTKMAEFDTQYSANGTSWHEDQEDADVFIRMRDDNGEWVQWNIGDIRERDWELLLGPVQTWDSGGGLGYDEFNFDYDLSDFEALKIDVQPFGHWLNSAPHQDYLGARLQAVLERGEGWMTQNSVASLTYGTQEAYAIFYDIYEQTGLTVFGIRDTAQNVTRVERQTAYPTFQGNAGNLARRNSFMMRFRTVGAGSSGDETDTDKVIFFAHDGHNRYFQVRIYGKRFLD